MKIDSFCGDYEFLSNFYETIVVYDGVTYKNSEAAYQAQKCVEPKDRDVFTTITAGKAKRLGRTVTLRKDWEQVKIPIMTDVVTAKFEQNKEIAKKLIDTGDAILEEGNNWGDRFWGTVNGHGKNMLGIILMNVREKLRNKT